MTKEEYLKIASEEYDSIHNLKKHDNFYDYEKEYVAIIQRLGLKVLEGNLGNVPEDRRKKKTLTQFGVLEIANDNPFSSGLNGFQVSPFLQEKIVFVGTNICYSKSDEFIKKLLDITINSSQTHRMTDTYAEILNEEDIENLAVEPMQKDEILYAELDGSFLFTRDEKWKEVKVGRIFRSTDCLNPNTKDAYLKRSFFTAHLGKSCDFILKFEDGINKHGSLGKRLVFITDGAVWIRNWIQENYPEAISILDFYHAMDYLCEFASSFYDNEIERKAWILDQKNMLLEGCILEVITRIKSLNAPQNITEKIVNYFESNLERMDYKAYQSIGCGIIGSGAIESAHRTLIQIRMKLSGQRWSMKGAKKMLKLRLAKENNQWCKVVQLFRKNAA